MLYHHLQADLRGAWAALSFARPEAFALLLLLPALVLLGWWSARRRRTLLAAVGSPHALYGLRTPPVWGRALDRLAYPLAWAFLIAGVAGPRWGKSDEGGVAVGRDLVVVVDVSRSMLADDMASQTATTRGEAAKAGVLDLLDAVAKKGGHRVGLVVFAARPAVLCPLTTDTDHLKAVAAEIDGRYPPPECRPGSDPAAVSGTRFGAAIAAAVGLHDPRFPGSQDVLLLSDGDDPVDDREWERGLDAARKANVPVHTVGVGDPDRSATIPLDGGFLEFPRPDGVPDTVQTQLNEKLLRGIAAETRGEYVPARRDVPNLGDFFRTRIEPRPSREVSDDHLPQPKDRTAWALVPALGLFLVGWLRGR